MYFNSQLPYPSHKKLWLEAKYLDFIFKLTTQRDLIREFYKFLFLKYHLLHFPTFKLRCE